MLGGHMPAMEWATLEGVINWPSSDFRFWASVVSGFEVLKHFVLSLWAWRDGAHILA